MIAAGGSTVRGLSFTEFAFGIYLTGTGNGGDSVTGNFIGTDPTGESSFSNFVGLDIDNAGNNTIGGKSPAARNLISGNDFGEGLEILNGSTANQVLGNYIGTDATGLARSRQLLRHRADGCSFHDHWRQGIRRTAI